MIIGTSLLIFQVKCSESIYPIHRKYLQMQTDHASLYTLDLKGEMRPVGQVSEDGRVSRKLPKLRFSF